MSNIKLAYPDGELQVLALAAMVPGRFYKYGVQTVFVDGVQEYATGDLAKVCTSGTYRCSIASGATAAVDAAAHYDPADQLIYTSTGSGRFVCGLFARAKTSGQTECLVTINRDINEAVE